MHKLQMYENLHDMIEREVMEIEKKNDLDEMGLDHLYKLMTALKYTDKCIDREESEMSSKNGTSYGRRYSNRMMPNWSYNDDRYSEDNFRDYTNRGRSYESGGPYEYSRDTSRKKMIQKLETLMDDTMSEHERQAIMDCIHKIQ